MTAQLVLAGLGHAHLFVLQALAEGRMPACAVRVCTAESQHVYSGMVPGWLGGRYALDELTIDVAALCAAAGAEWIPHHVSGLDPAARTLTLANGDSVPFDVCSLAVGSVPTGLGLAGAREHALPLKPLRNVERLRERVDAMVAGGRGSITVVGGGLAGVEIALGVRARDRSRKLAVSIVSRDDTLAPGRSQSLGRAMARACAQQGVRFVLGAGVREVSGAHVTLADGARVTSDVTVWATGPSAQAWLSTSGLTVDDRGFVLVDDYLRSVAAAHVFAAGDCATLASAPQTPKAGVYAVRMGPLLARGLAAAIQGHQPPQAFVPQGEWLSLVNTGDGAALASYGPFTLRGRWAMWLKDMIDRRFISRFSAVARRRRADVSQ